MKSRWFG